MSKIVEKEGLMTTTYHQEKDKVVIERNIDYKPIVEHNKKLGMGERDPRTGVQMAKLGENNFFITK